MCASLLLTTHTSSTGSGIERRPIRGYGVFHHGFKVRLALLGAALEPTAGYAFHANAPHLTLKSLDGQLRRDASEKNWIRLSVLVLNDQLPARARSNASLPERPVLRKF